MPIVSPDFDLDFSVDGSNGDDLDAIDAGWSYIGAVSSQTLEKAGGAYLVSTATGGGQVAAYGHAMGDPDDALEATVRLSTIDDVSDLLLGIRFNTATFSGYYAVWSAGSGQWELRESAGGSPTTLDAWNGDSPSNGDTRLVRIQATGTTITVFVDGVERMSAVDATYSSGSFFCATVGEATASTGQILETLTGGEWVDPVTGTLGASLQPLTATLTGTFTAPEYTGTLGASLEPLTATLTGTFVSTASTGTLGASLQPLTASLTATYTPPVTGTLGASLQPLTATLTGTAAAAAAYTGTLGATLQALTAGLTGTYVAPATGTLGASLQALTATLTGTFGLYTYALKVGASELPVRPGGHRAREVPMADEVVIDINGVARSGITAYRGYMTHVSIETPELDASDLDALYTTLNVGTPLTFTGYLVGGSLTAVVRNLRYVPGDIDRALACDIVQSG